MRATIATNWLPVRTGPLGERLIEFFVTFFERIAWLRRSYAAAGAGVVHPSEVAGTRTSGLSVGTFARPLARGESAADRGRGSPDRTDSVKERTVANDGRLEGVDWVPALRRNRRGRRQQTKLPSLSVVINALAPDRHNRKRPPFRRLPRGFMAQSYAR
jgi:hypothetical protein